MAELKTKRTSASVDDFIGGIENESTRKDCYALLALMKKATKAAPRMWGPSIVGFGDYHYKYESGREADWFQVGFSPRKQNLALYLMTGLGRHDALLRKLGKYTTGKSCLYVKRLADIDPDVLGETIAASLAELRKKA
jgi:hypothetical protein